MITFMIKTNQNKSERALCLLLTVVNFVKGSENLLRVVKLIKALLKTKGFVWSNKEYFIYTFCGHSFVIL